MIQIVLNFVGLLPMILLKSLQKKLKFIFMVSILFFVNSLVKTWELEVHNNASTSAEIQLELLGCSPEVRKETISSSTVPQKFTIDCCVKRFLIYRDNELILDNSPENGC